MIERSLFVLCLDARAAAARVSEAGEATGEAAGEAAGGAVGGAVHDTQLRAVVAAADCANRWYDKACQLV
eukprot:1789687-Prymnesium_polylepis.1